MTDNEKQENKEKVAEILSEVDRFTTAYMKIKGCSSDEALKAFIAYTHKQYKQLKKIEKLFIKLGI